MASVVQTANVARQQRTTASERGNLTDTPTPATTPLLPLTAFVGDIVADAG
jgi:hypothetical protein